MFKLYNSDFFGELRDINNSELLDNKWRELCSIELCDVILEFWGKKSELWDINLEFQEKKAEFWVYSLQFWLFFPQSEFISSCLNWDKKKSQLLFFILWQKHASITFFMTNKLILLFPGFVCSFVYGHRLSMALCWWSPLKGSFSTVLTPSRII